MKVIGSGGARGIGTGGVRGDGYTNGKTTYSQGIAVAPGDRTLAAFTINFPATADKAAQISLELDVREPLRFRAGGGMLRKVSLERDGALIEQGGGPVTIGLDPGQHTLILRGELP